MPLDHFWPFFVYAGLVLVVVGAMIGISYLLGERHKGRATHEPYESGVPITDSARVRYAAKFYLVAMFFVIFDLEAVFLFAWAISFEEAGWKGYFAMLFFVVILLVALVYLWRMGALDWGTSRRIQNKNQKRNQIKEKTI